MAALIAACTALAVIPVPDPDPLGPGVVPRRDIAGIIGGGGRL